MKSQREQFGGLGNQMFRGAFLYALMRNGEIPDIYVQSIKYWEKYRYEIKALFSEGLSIPPVQKVALHIRRGDYVANPFYVNLWETDYYKKAVFDMEVFYLEKHGTLPHYIVFCRDNQGWENDKKDRQWCRDNLDNLLGDRWTLAPKENSETDDLNLMASCTCLIMANSSFSWWGAFLGWHEKVIAPRAWHTDEVQRTEPLPEWTQI